MHEYMAGIVDGEGSIVFKIRHRSKHQRPSSKGCLDMRLSVYNKDFKLIQWLLDNYGGGWTIAVHKGKLMGAGKYSASHDVYAWAIYEAKSVYEILRAIEPFLIIKKSKAQEAIELLKTRL